MTRKLGEKLASFWWISSGRFGRAKLSGSGPGLSRYTTMGPASSSETPETPTPTRPCTSPARACSAHRSTRAAAIQLEADTELHPEEVWVPRGFLDVGVGDAP